jgi:hypothetical protein
MSSIAPNGTSNTTLRELVKWINSGTKHLTCSVAHRMVHRMYSTQWLASKRFQRLANMAYIVVPLKCLLHRVRCVNANSFSNS